jgi:hypothetical protein
MVQVDRVGRPSSAPKLPITTIQLFGPIEIPDDVSGVVQENNRSVDLHASSDIQMLYPFPLFRAPGVLGD